MNYPVTVVGGTGVFGRHIVEALLKSPIGFDVTVAARQAKAFLRQYPQPPQNLHFRQLDLNCPQEVASALTQTKLFIVAAGPFQTLSPEIAVMAARQNVHYLDLCDDPVYLENLLRRRAEFSGTHAVVLSGLSSLPGISLPLAELIIPDFDVLHAIDIGLFIGNRNQKGRGAVFSSLENLKRPAQFIENGELIALPSWSQPVRYEYPDPIGTFRSYSIASPDALVFRARHRCKHLTVRVAFEWRLARLSFSLFRKLTNLGGHGLVKTAVSLLFPVFALAHRIGSERGCVSVTITGMRNGDPVIRRASLYGDLQGQRMASLPCVIAAEALARNEIQSTGFLDLTEWLAPSLFFGRLHARGFETRIEEIL